VLAAVETTTERWCVPQDSMENDSVADSEETDPEASKMLDVPDPDTSRVVVTPELIDP
jgi:hypothetical protein